MQSFSAAEQKRPVTLASWGWTQCGDRPGENQDAFLNWPEKKFWGVADGLGGTELGAAASRLLMRSFMGLKDYESLGDFIRKIRAVLVDDNDILCAQNKVGASAASTIVTLLMHESEAACLWAGDSRCYLFRNDVLYQCTHDHTLRQQKIDSGELTVPEAYRMVRGNIITSAVGVKEDMRLDEVRFPLRAGDRFLLCSDGLSNLLSADSLTRHMSRQTPKACCESMVEAIKDVPQPDNITFVVVFLSMAAR